VMRWYDAYLRMAYRRRHRTAAVRLLNRVSMVMFGAGIGPRRAAVLEVVGRSSGRVLSVPVVVTDWNGERYLVSMLGERANWVRNVRAAQGRAVLRHGKREAVVLTNVVPEERPPIVRRYLAIAPGARPHIHVDRHAPLEDFAAIAGEIPVVRVTSAPTQISKSTPRPLEAPLSQD
jgi:F420H(2)-dependent quinone reductase